MSDWKVGDRIEARVIAVLNDLVRVQIATEDCAREAWIPVDALTRAADPAPFDAAEREVVEAAKAELVASDAWASVDSAEYSRIARSYVDASDRRIAAVRRLLALAAPAHPLAAVLEVLRDAAEPYLFQPDSLLTAAFKHEVDRRQTDARAAIATLEAHMKGEG